MLEQHERAAGIRGPVQGVGDSTSSGHPHPWLPGIPHAPVSRRFAALNYCCHGLLSQCSTLSFVFCNVTIDSAWDPRTAHRRHAVHSETRVHNGIRISLVACIRIT